MSRFYDVFDRVIGHEGGYSNDPKDPGGETKFGISKRAYPDLDIANLTVTDAQAIYLRDYWNKIRGDDLPQPLDEFIFDFAVNSGVRPAAMALQIACGASPDGVIGDATIEAVKRMKVSDLLRVVFVKRAMTFALNQNVGIYGKGWFARLFDLTYRPT